MQLDEIVNGFLSFLSARKLDYLLPEIVNKLQENLKSREDTAFVTSAVDLSEKEREKLKDFLKREFGRDLKMRILVDPEILGGLKIIVGDRMIDQTVTGRLSLIEEWLH